tara:strand:- start:4397 stop:5194 length:798 start_codon:yes stop_codon:yes gene_type:complete
MKSKAKALVDKIINDLQQMDFKSAEESKTAFMCLLITEDQEAKKVAVNYMKRKLERLVGNQPSLNLQGVQENMMKKFIDEITASYNIDISEAWSKAAIKDLLGGLWKEAMSEQKSNVDTLEGEVQREIEKSLQPEIVKWGQRQEQEQINIADRLNAAAESLKKGGKEHKEAREVAKQELQRRVEKCSDVKVLEKIQDDIKNRMKKQGLYAKVKRFCKKYTQTGALETQCQERIEFLKERQQQRRDTRAMKIQQNGHQRGHRGRMP